MTPERLSQWKIIQHVTLIAYMGIMYKTFEWFTELPEPTVIQNTFATMVWGGALIWIKLYQWKPGGNSNNED